MSTSEQRDHPKVKRMNPEILARVSLSPSQVPRGIVHSRLRTMDWKNGFSPFLSLFFTLVHFATSDLTQEQCKSLGFTTQLLCSSCDELSAFKMPTKLLEDCRSCCNVDGDLDSTKVCITT